MLRTQVHYRNLALHRPAYQSSAYDYNLTAQLITDGIKESSLPQWIETSTSDAGTLPKTERELFLDGNVTSSVNVSGESPWVEFDLKGGGEAPEIDRIDLYLRKIYGRSLSGIWTYTVSGSDDRVTGRKWDALQALKWPDMRELRARVSWRRLPLPRRRNFVRIACNSAAPNVRAVGSGGACAIRQGAAGSRGGSGYILECLDERGEREEWVYVDLGAVCTFDRIGLAWIQRAVRRLHPDVG